MLWWLHLLAGNEDWDAGTRGGTVSGDGGHRPLLYVPESRQSRHTQHTECGRVCEAGARWVSQHETHVSIYSHSCWLCHSTRHVSPSTVTPADCVTAQDTCLHLQSLLLTVSQHKTRVSIYSHSCWLCHSTRHVSPSTVTPADCVTAQDTCLHLQSLLLTVSQHKTRVSIYSHSCWLCHSTRHVSPSTVTPADCVTRRLFNL